MAAHSLHLDDDHFAAVFLRQAPRIGRDGDVPRARPHRVLNRQWSPPVV